MSASDVIRALGEVHELSKTEDISGCWIGRVEDIDDPRRMNRVRVRIHAFHGSKDASPTRSLPWAETTSLNGGGYDYGSAGQLYPVGSNVWVMFAMGKLDSPVVIGGHRSKTRVKDENNDGQLLTLDGTSASGADATWIPEEDEEITKDVFSDSYQADNHPTRTVWQKSLKGHTILVEDRDGFECLQIIDRAGQIIEMNCPVTAQANENNAEQRGSRTSVKDNQVSQDSLVNGRAFIKIKDVAGQEIILDGRANKEAISLISRNRVGTSEQKIILSSSKGSEYIEVIDKQGSSIKLDPNGSSPIVIRDYTGNSIEFDAESGEVRTTCSGRSSGSVNSDFTQSVGGTRSFIVGGDDDLKVVGKKTTSVVNDLTATVGGLTSLALTGPVQAQIANAQLSAGGAPAVTGLDVEVVLGNISVSSKIGGMALKAPIGINVEGSTSGESMALGDTLSSALQELHDIFSNNAANFGIGNMGAPVPINPAVISALAAWAVKFITSPASNIISQIHTVSRL